jgi:SAM-dependent methyltransferase
MPRTKLQPAVHPFDQLHGTDTSGLLAGKVIAQGTGAKVEELTAYYGVAPSILRGLLDLWIDQTAPQPVEQTVFLDVGAGKGRAMLLASQYPFLRVEGVELNPELAAITKANIGALAVRSRGRCACPTYALPGRCHEAPAAQRTYRSLPLPSL